MTAVEANVIALIFHHANCWSGAVHKFNGCNFNLS